MKNVQKLYAPLLDKTKPYAQELTPTLLKNLVLVGCLILVKETVNLNKLKNHVGILLDISPAGTVLKVKFWGRIILISLFYM